MGVYKGKTSKGLYLTTAKHRRIRSRHVYNYPRKEKHIFSKSLTPCRRSTPHSKKIQSPFKRRTQLSVSFLSPVRRSTPHPVVSKRRIVSSVKKISPSKSPFKSPLRKKWCSSLRKNTFTPTKSKRSLTYGPLDSTHRPSGVQEVSLREELIFGSDAEDESTQQPSWVHEDSLREELIYGGDAEDTILYSDDCSGTSSDSACDKLNEPAGGSDTNIHELFGEAIERLESHSKGDEIITFLRLVVEGKFPLNNVAFLLFTDVVKWFSSDDVRRMRYSETTMKFFWLGKKLFGSRFIRFMSGPKNETDFLTGSHKLSPLSSKINFDCPSDNILRNYHPLGCDFGDAETSSGLINQMIDLTASKSNKDVSYVIMFDGKKIKRGSDMDLLGFEKEPLAVKKQIFQDDLDVIENTLNALQTANKTVETRQDIDSSTKNRLFGFLVNCSKTVSRYLMELRKLRQQKDSAMRNYKEKISKDPSLSKTLEYAMDSCRTSCYQIDLCISQLLEIQLEVCRAGSYLNGTLYCFATSKFVDIKQQTNVKLLQPVQEMRRVLGVENIPSNYIKQRSEEWFCARKTVKVTGSTVYAAIGCDTLKSQNEHFDKVFHNKEKTAVSASQEKAMKHGTESEEHEIATLSSVIMPFLFPEMTFHEEGYYVEDGVIVSPDGSLRDKTGNRVFHGFEGKAPMGNEYVVQQHYKVPERYITQTLFEDKALNAEKGTLYLCWTEDSTTAFMVPFDNSIYESCQDIIHNTFMCEEPKRQSRLSKESKVLKESLKNHISKCEYIGEFPSMKAIDSGILPKSNKTFTFSDSIKALLQAKTTVTDAHNLQRTYASQVVVYLLADLDRLWKSEMPHAVPVMYYYRGYSLPMETARALTEHCTAACEEKEIDVVAIASDGEFNHLMVRTKDQVPLTLYQLSKDVWKEVCKMKKHQLINQFRILNTQYRSSTDENGKLFLDSLDGSAARVTTSPHGWLERSRRTHSDKNVQQACNALSSVESEVDNHTQSSGTLDIDSGMGNQTIFSATHTPDIETSAEPDNVNQDVSDITGCYESEDIEELNPYLDETVEYDIDAILESTNAQEQDSVQMVTAEIAAEILKLFCELKPSKWTNKSPDNVLDLIHGSLKTFTKAELLIIAEYFGFMLKTSRENKLLKNDIVAQLATFFGIDMTVNDNRHRIFKPKSLKDIATQILRQKSFPKQALNIAYAEYIWPMKECEWRKGNRVSVTVIVKGETEDLEFKPYYTPEFQAKFRVFVYDKTHLGTNLRKFLCLNKVEGVSIEAWKAVSQLRPDILHPTIIEVSPEGKILDQMKEKLARTTVSIGVEETMIECGYEKEAEFCKVVREGLFAADDTPGIHAFDRCRKRIDLINWLNRDIHFGKFPPYGGYIKGLSNILYEGLRTSQEAKLYLYALAKTGSYCVRAPNTLCSESFFGSMQDMDPWGQGILSAKGVQKHISDFATITAMKMEEDRNIFIKTKRSTAYPQPETMTGTKLRPDRAVARCLCREQGVIKCIVPKDHFFDTEERARVHKGEKLYKAPQRGVFRGEQNIRSQYGYKINESRIPPSKLYVRGFNDKESSEK